MCFWLVLAQGCDPARHSVNKLPGRCEHQSNYRIWREKKMHEQTNNTVGLVVSVTWMKNCSATLYEKVLQVADMITFQKKNFLSS